MSKWDKLWAWFDYKMNSVSSFADSFSSVEDLQRHVFEKATVETIYKDGDLSIRVKGKVKSVTINGKTLKVETL